MLKLLCKIIKMLATKMDIEANAQHQLNILTLQSSAHININDIFSIRKNMITFIISSNILQNWVSLDNSIHKYAYLNFDSWAPFTNMV